MRETGIFKGLSLQVLDDNPFYATLLEHQLNRFIADQFISMSDRIQVKSYTDYKHYLKELPLSYSVSLIDFYLGNGMTGTDLIRSIRAHSAYCKVIILTSGTNLHVVPACIEAGASGVVFKDDYTLGLCESVIRDVLNNCIFPEQKGN
jgi:DNA-binding NarL/FixJ family response regulator